MGKTALTTASRVQTRQGKDETIQIRASAELKTLLNRAATLRNQKLSEFMLSSARREAEAALLDQRLFLLAPAPHERFLAILDKPPRISAETRRRLSRKPIWERAV